MEQLYAAGDIKFGDLIGEDKFGNKYYENTKDYPFGQHRWVEFKDIHNFDATMIPPSWHGWMHHQTDDPPHSLQLKSGKPIATGVTTPFKDTHVAQPGEKYEEEFMHNWTGFKQRGYKIGSIHQKTDENDKVWRQKGHPLSKANSKN